MGPGNRCWRRRRPADVQRAAVADEFDQVFTPTVSETIGLADNGGVYQAVLAVVTR